MFAFKINGWMTPMTITIFTKIMMAKAKQNCHFISLSIVHRCKLCECVCVYLLGFHFSIIVWAMFILTEHTALAKIDTRRQLWQSSQAIPCLSIISLLHFLGRQPLFTVQFIPLSLSLAFCFISTNTHPHAFVFWPPLRAPFNVCFIINGFTVGLPDFRVAYNFVTSNFCYDLCLPLFTTRVNIILLLTANEAVSYFYRLFTWLGESKSNSCTIFVFPLRIRQTYTTTISEFICFSVVESCSCVFIYVGSKWEYWKSFAQWVLRGK